MPNSVSDTADITYLGLGVPSLTEVYERACHDLGRLHRHIAGPVEVIVRPTVRSQRYVQHALQLADEVSTVVRAAVKTHSIEARSAIVAYHFHLPVVDGIDCLYVSFRPALAPNLMLV